MAESFVSKPSAAVSVSRLLDENLVVFSESRLNKEEAIRDLLARLCQVRNLGSPDSFLSKILERENGPTTTLDTGLAIPHARIDGFKDIFAILGLYPSVVTDPSQPDLPIRAVFLFLSPNDPEFFQRNLKLLQKLAIVFQPALIEKLLAAKAPNKILELIRQKE